MLPDTLLKGQISELTSANESLSDPEMGPFRVAPKFVQR